MLIRPGTCLAMLQRLQASAGGEGGRLGWVAALVAEEAAVKVRNGSVATRSSAKKSMRAP